MLGIGLRVSPRLSVATIVTPLDQLIEDLGGHSAVVGIYQGDTNVTVTGSGVSSWADARGAAHPSAGPTFVQAGDVNRPPWASNTLTFDGSQDFLAEGSTGRLSELSDGNLAVALVTNILSATAARFPFVFSARPGGADIIRMERISSAQVNVANASVAANILGLTNPTGLRVFHARRSQVGGNAQMGARVGNGAEDVTGAAAVAVPTPASFSLGIDGVSVTGLCNMALKLVLIYKGSDYTSGSKYALVNSYAQTHLGASV